jgi:hypothetical protein
MAATRLNSTLCRLFRAPVHLYRWRCGWLLGNRFLLLIHVGRRTGLRRHTVLEVVAYRKEGPEAVVISAFGGYGDGGYGDSLRDLPSTIWFALTLDPHRHQNTESTTSGG